MYQIGTLSTSADVYSHSVRRSRGRHSKEQQLDSLCINVSYLNGVKKEKGLDKKKGSICKPRW